MSPSFWKSLLFPVRGHGGWIFLALGTGLLTLDQTVTLGRRRNPILYAIIFTGLVVSSYLYRTLEDTVDGHERPSSPIPPSWQAGWWDLFHYLGGLFVAFLPVAALLVFAAFEQEGRLARRDFQILLGGLAVLGTLYLPMALLLNGFAQRAGMAFHFGVAFRGIARMGPDYGVCCLYFLASHSAWVFLELFWVRPNLPVWNGERVAAAAGTAVAGLYLSVLQMRQLGLLFRKHRDVLGWTLGPGA